MWLGSSIVAGVVVWWWSGRLIYGAFTAVVLILLDFMAWRKRSGFSGILDPPMQQSQTQVVQRSESDLSQNVTMLSAGNIIDSLQKLTPGQRLGFPVTTYGHRTIDACPGRVPEEIEGRVLLPMMGEGEVFELPFTGGAYSIGKVVATYPPGHVFTVVLLDGSMKLDAGDGNKYSVDEAAFFGM